jgi:predicted ester cyclase
MAQKESSLSYRWFEEVWNKNNPAVIDELLDENVITHGLDAEGKGIEAFKTFYKEFTENFKDIHVQVEQVIMEDDYEVARCSASAIQKMTGRKVEFTGVVINKIKDGKVIEAWNNFDFLSMYLQLGQKLS